MHAARPILVRTTPPSQNRAVDEAADLKCIASRGLLAVYPFAMNPFRLAVGVQCAVIASCLLYSLGQASAEQSLDYSRALGDAVTSSLQAGAQAAGSPRDKLLAWAGALHGALKPVADRARLGAGEVGTVGPKPWSPVPPSAFAMLPPFVGSVVNGSTLKFNSRCNRTTTVMVRSAWCGNKCSAAEVALSALSRTSSPCRAFQSKAALS